MIINNAASRRSVSFWTNHLEDTKENERAELKEIRGLRAAGLEDALLEMKHEAASRPRLRNFMYHADFNPPKSLTEKEWERSFEIFEKERGIPEGTPRVVVEHEKHGRIHRHVIWARLDPHSMRAFPDGLDAKTAHAAARKIELELGLERVIGPFDREPGTPRPHRGPRPWEMYRALKTGIDPRDLNVEVTQLFKQSDNGKAFHAALEQHGYSLCTGNRGLLILDSVGKEHSLARRIEGVKTAELNAFMRDVDRQTLPTVEQAKVQYQERKINALEADRATVTHQIEWEEALVKAAIAKEEKERQFMEPSAFAKAAADRQERERQVREGGRERVWPIHPPQPEAVRPEYGWNRPEHTFENAANAATRPEPDPPMPENLRGAAANIWTAWHHSDNAKAFAAALDEQNISLAAVTKEEAGRSHINASFAKEVGNYAPRYREGEIVAIAEPGLAYGDDGKLPAPRVYKLNERTTGESAASIERFLTMLDRSGLQGIEATKETLTARAEQRISDVEIFREMLRDQRNAERLENSQQIYGQNAAQVGAKESIFTPAATVVDAGTRLFGKGLDAIAKAAASTIEMLGDMIAPAKPTKESIWAAVEAQERAAEQREIDFFARREDHDAAQSRINAREAEKVAEDEDRYYRKKKEQENERER